MKNSILIFLLGIFVTISIAATVPNTGLFTVKPAKPISTLVLHNRNCSNYQEYISKGYQIKTVELGNSGSIVMILEKY